MDERQNAGLVLTRRVGEQIIITVPGLERKIVVTLCSIDRDGRARIGVKAPGVVAIDRKEIAERRAATAAGSVCPQSVAGG